MRDEDDAERDAPPADSDRLLVRPYIGRTPGGPSYQLPESGRPPAGAPTADSAAGAGSPTGHPAPGADRTAGGDAVSPAVSGEGAPTASLPVVASPAPRRRDPALDDRDRRQVLWLVGVGIAIALAAVAGLIALWPRADEAPPAADAPPAVTPAPEASAPAVPAPGAPPASSAAPPPTTSATGAPAARPTSAAATTVPTRPAAPPPTGTTSPPPALAAPPTADRAGTITGAGGRCLDVAGGIVFPGSPLAVNACNGTLSQRWTLATDGTLRVSGSCATADGADTVEVAACGDAPAGQWRAGPAGTLVNGDSGGCLTETADGGRVGLASCGATGQRWTLP